MGSIWVRGIVAGFAASALSIATNLRRGNPHLVTGAPSLLGAVAVAALAPFGGQACADGSGRQAGVRAMVASGVCAVAMGAFTWFYLPNHVPTLAAYSAFVSFVLVYIVGYAATRLGVRSNLRLHRTAAR
jgi:hypothetical protein